ncbi:DNA polymerase III subunit alpha [Bacteroidales bacterium]
MFLIFDTETTGIPRDKNAPFTDFENWPRVVQLSWQLHDELGKLVESGNFIIRPDGFTIPFNAAKIHGITTDYATQHGVALSEALDEFELALEKTHYIVGHNIDFDRSILAVEHLRLSRNSSMIEKTQIDTCSETTATFCQLPGGKGGRFKLPTLSELHHQLFKESFGSAHNAQADVAATARCFFELLRQQVMGMDNQLLSSDFFQIFKEANPEPFRPALIVTGPAMEETTAESPISETIQTEQQEQFHRFAHLRTHSTYSILNSTIDLPDLIKRAIEEKMPALGLTDTANLMAAFNFITKIGDYNIAEKKAVEEGRQPSAHHLKPVLGCEFYICRDHTDKTTKDNGYLVPIIAKNKGGYQNLSMLSSIATTEGFYYVPRISREVLLNHKNHLIVTTGGPSGEVPSLLLNVGEHQAENALIWWKEHFGDDFYIELNRHGLEEEDFLNDFLLKMASKHQIKYFAANNVHYLDRQDADTHDYLLCIKDNNKKNDPIGRGYGKRFGFPNDEFYFKTEQEMSRLFADLPEAIETIGEIIDKVEEYSLKRNVALPEFTIPEAFADPDNPKLGESNYLKHLAQEGAQQRYGELTQEASERLSFELDVIINSGYSGYFLIVQDLIATARRMGVWVGPGRGSAAGSIVAYVLGITNIDPLKYGLLFERFLNPERVSMPDIDIDFDDEGRSKVMDYVINKYGQNKVAQIITYGTLGTKMAIRDVGRTLEAEQKQVDKLANSTGNVSLGDFFRLTDKELANKYKTDQLEKGYALKARMEKEKDSLETKILTNAIKIEGLVRNTGIHACGIVITPCDLRDMVPVTLSKDSNMWATQFDNDVAEKAGLLKVDFLGLKTLSLIRDTIELIRQRYGRNINPDEISLDDAKTYELFRGGETIGIFQFESQGMQKHLRELKPTNFYDLIAMVALYRPGPMQYIPNYIKRKNGLEPVTYDLEVMKEILEETFGITVYQEQVMMLSQRIANFSRGQADTLRKAMGKKLPELQKQLNSTFMDGGMANGYPPDVLKKIWEDWLAFAKYAFNKSHATSYAYVSFQTAYLKANYPAEYMAAVLSNNLNDIKQVTFFMEECKRLNLKVLGPDVNESEKTFTVNTKGEIRFGLGAIRNMGESAAESILNERRENGRFKTVFDFFVRSNLRIVNKRTIEALVTSGAFDSFNNIHRAQFFYKDVNDSSIFLEKLLRNAAMVQNSRNSAQTNLFGESSDTEVSEPTFPQCEPWSKIKELKEEYEAIGFYISAHPMDDYKITIHYFTNCDIRYIHDEMPRLQNQQIRFAAQITSAEHTQTQQGKGYGRFKAEDSMSSIEASLFGENYLRLKHFLEIGTFVLIHASVQPSFRNKDEMELKVTDIQLLDNVLEQSGRPVRFNLHVDKMNNEMWKEFISLVKTHRHGKHRFSIVLLDGENNLNVRLVSRKNRIHAAELLPKIENLSYVKYELES